MSFFAWIRKRSRPYALAALGVAISFVLFAIVVEVTDPNDYNLLTKDPSTGLFLYTKNSTFHTSGDCYENTVVVNNLGLHGPAVSLQKGKNIFRILVVGSSYAAALQVPVEEMYSSILEKKLNAIPNKKYTYEVVPLALNQNGTFLDMLYYKNYGSQLSPDVVVDLETQYELIEKLDNPPQDATGDIILMPPKYGEDSRVASIRAWSRHSKLLVNLYNRFLVLNEAIHSFLAAPLAPFWGAQHSAQLPIQAPSAEQDRWQIKEKLVDTFASLVKVGNARFIFASWTNKDVPAAIAQELPRHMQEIAQRQGFSYANLVPVYVAQEQAADQQGTLSCDIHWAAAGNEYIANALYGYLVQHPSLLSR